MQTNKMVVKPEANQRGVRTGGTLPGHRIGQEKISSDSGFHARRPGNYKSAGTFGSALRLYNRCGHVLSLHPRPHRR